MNLEHHLNTFYEENGIPAQGGMDDTTFVMKVFGMNVRLHNPQFRREVIHIHDLQHVLNNKDTSWKGEAYIAGWEIATGMWKNIMLGLMSLWAMGYSLWIYPVDVYQGYKKGLSNLGIIDLKYSRAEFLKMEYHQLEELTRKATPSKMDVLNTFQFLFWTIVSQIVFLFPLLLIGSIIYYKLN